MNSIEKGILTSVPIALIICLVYFLCSCAAVPVKDMNPDDRNFIEKAMAQPLEFKIDKLDADNAWGRAQAWIGQWSGMKIQAVSEYIIQTYNPKNASFGYYATRRPFKDYDLIQVECLGTINVHASVCTRNAHLLAYFIKTGDMGNTGLINGGSGKEKKSVAVLQY